MQEENINALCFVPLLQGLAARMFGKVIGKPLKTAVIRSVLRGNKTCAYRIEL